VRLTEKAGSMWNHTTCDEIRCQTGSQPGGSPAYHYQAEESKRVSIRLCRTAREREEKILARVLDSFKCRCSQGQTKILSLS
jgi:hypothetical protein